jgi:hypothetical protein
MGFSPDLFLLGAWAPNYGVGRIKAIAESGHCCMVAVQVRGDATPSKASIVEGRLHMPSRHFDVALH